MKMILSKQAQKTMSKSSGKTKKRFEKALVQIQNNQGDIKHLIPLQKGMADNLYRLKMEHYRIIFEKSENCVVVKSIATKNDTSLRRTGCC